MPDERYEPDAYHEEGPEEWRQDAKSHLAKDSSDGRHRAGARVVAVTLSKDRRGNLVSFERPSTAALAVNIAHSAAERAMKLQTDIEYSEINSLAGSAESVTPVAIPALFDYFEHCMVAVTFSFQALEAYCNYVIARDVPGTYAFQKRKGEVVNLTAIELERQASTEEKLADVLPDLLDIASPKGKVVWQKFKVLKEKRDATVHIKSVDQAPKVAQLQFLSQHTDNLGARDKLSGSHRSAQPNCLSRGFATKEHVRGSGVAKIMTRSGNTFTLRDARCQLTQALRSAWSWYIGTMCHPRMSKATQEGK